MNKNHIHYTYLFCLPVRHPDPGLSLGLPGDGESGHGQPVLGGDQAGLLVTVMDRGDHAACEYNNCQMVDEKLQDHWEVRFKVQTKRHSKEDVVVSTNLEFNQNLVEICREVSKSLTKLVAWFYCLKRSKYVKSWEQRTINICLIYCVPSLKYCGKCVIWRLKAERIN